MPSSRHVRMTRIAISPRFAIRIFDSNGSPGWVAEPARAAAGGRILKLVPEPFASWHDARLDGTRFGPVQWFAAIDSTNRVLLEDGARGAAGAGRGRRRADLQGRPAGGAWVAPPARRCWCRCCSARRSRRRLALVRGRGSAVGAVRAGRYRSRPQVGRTTSSSPTGSWRDPRREGRCRRGWWGLGCVRWESFPAELAEIATACNLCRQRRWRRGSARALADPARRAARRSPSVIGGARMQSALGRQVQIELPGGTFEPDASRSPRTGARRAARRWHRAAGQRCGRRSPSCGSERFPRIDLRVEPI
jgi:hypothetical protein